MTNANVVTFSGADADHIRRVRTAVFGAEQGVPAAVDFDGRDAAATQVLAWLDGRPVGTGRMLADGHIGRIAVLAQDRGRGIGEAIMRTLMAEAVRLGCRRVFLGAQTHATGFYARLGFSPYGAHYMEAGIEHIHMERHLDPALPN